MQDTSTRRSAPAEERPTNDQGTVPIFAQRKWDCPPPKSRWLRFLAGLSAILIFAFGVVPALQQLGPVREVRDVIRNTGIDATALFYTDSEVFPEAESSIRDMLRFSARRAQHAAEQPPP